MIHSLKHYTETDTFPLCSQCQRIGIFRNIAITDKRLITVVNKTVVIHITIFQVTHFDCPISRLRKVWIGKIGRSDKSVADQTKVLIDGMTFTFTVIRLQRRFVHTDNLIAGM